MKSLKRIQSIILTIVLVMQLVSVSSTTAFAEGNATIPHAVHIYTQSIGDNGINIALAEAEDKITDIKTSSTDLVAKQTYYRTNSNLDEVTEANIGLYAKKDGKYTVTVKISNKSGQEKESAKITVYANKDEACKSVTFQGKNLSGLKTVESGKVKVTMNNGYKLVSLEYGIDKSSKDESGNVNTDTIYKTFKNDEIIKLGTESYKYSSSYSYDESDGTKYFDEYSSASLYANTYIRITYIDKYTNEKTQLTYTMCRLATN